VTQAPALFVSHGAPTFALEPGLLGPELSRLGEELGDIAAVAVISAHWQTTGAKVMRTAAPQTMHDFGGFPAALYQLQYPAPGAPAVAGDAAELLEAQGFHVDFDDRRGLDHGVWVPLRYLLPAAATPVFQISLPFDLTAQRALLFGKALAPLRERGVLVMGSGSLTHNLAEFFSNGPGAAPYAVEFAEWIRRHVEPRDIEALVNYRRLAPHAVRAHPTEEHFLPLLVALGASDAAEQVRILEGEMSNGVLSMESYVFGAAH
jgi:4,5-DOPA dioxygenase extradiol